MLRVAWKKEILLIWFCDNKIFTAITHWHFSARPNIAGRGFEWETEALAIETSSRVIKRLEITCFAFHLYTKAYKTFFCYFLFSLIFLVYLLNTQHYASALFTSLVNNISSSSRWLAFSYCFPQISTFSFFPLFAHIV